MVMTMTRGYKMFIDGAWVDAVSGGTFHVVNPATEESIASAPDGDADDVQRAIEAARRAFDEGPWPRMSQQDRSKVLQQIAAGLTRNYDRLRTILIEEAGCAQYLVRMQLDDPLTAMHSYADLAATASFEDQLPPLVQQTASGVNATEMLVYRQAAGVVAAINTWNFPLYVLVQKLGPALAAGCTMVLKAAPYAPLINLEVAKVIEETDLPSGVVNVVTGQSVASSEVLVSSPLIDKISFTGSVPTGKKIAEAAAKNLTRLHLELGGKSACIVLEDADVEAMAPVMASPAFVHAGQACAATTRCLVPEKLYERAMASMVGFVSKLRVGDPSDPEVMVGPVIREERRTAIEAYIASGRDEGATVATGGRRPAGIDRGFFLEPTIFGDVRHDMRIAREEIFGPVLSVSAYHDLDEAVRIANNSRYGLSGRVVTHDTEKGVEVAKRLRTGSVLLGHGFGGPGALTFTVAPFGGFKESGLGREGGKFGVQEFTEIQTIAW